MRSATRASIFNYLSSKRLTSDCQLYHAAEHFEVHCLCKISGLGPAGDLFDVDPPYYGTEGYYRAAFPRADQEALAELLWSPNSLGKGVL